MNQGARVRRRETGVGTQVRIRRARQSDAERIADLSGELGYPATHAQVAKRLRKLRPTSQHAVFVAESPQADVIGWVHVSTSHLLESEMRAEVNGLIVADGHRSSGAGAKLLEAAEQWARKHRCHTVNLRSNVIRGRAHAFYLRQGYEHYKTQKAFRKPLI